MSKKVAYLVVLVFFLIFHPPVFADNNIVINEILANPSGSSSEPNEFIELFNKGPNTITITGWKLIDAVDKTFIIPEITLKAEEYVTFRREDTKIALNNSDEKIKLVDVNDQQVDSFSYENTIEDRSYSRIPDGTGDFVNNTDITEGTKNSPPPSPTPTPDPSPSSSASQSTSAKSPTPTPKTTSTATTKSPSSTSAKQSPLVLSAASTSSLLLASSSSESTLSSPSPEATASALSKTKVAGILVGSGIVLIGLSIGFYFWYHRVLRNPQKEQNENHT